MKLYHGTSAKHLPTILKHGLKPRGKKRGNWQHTVTSNPMAVYLTDAYPIHFAQAATRGKELLAILEIDIDCLDLSRMAPDEDCLEQATRSDPTFKHIGNNVKDRTMWFRKRALKQFGHTWKTSLELMGTCCYYGDIPPSAITRSVKMPYKHPLSMASDPVICIDNYRIMGGYYRNLVRYVFGDDVEEENTPSSYASRLRELANRREGLTTVETGR